MSPPESMPAPRPFARRGAGEFGSFVSLEGNGSRSVEAWFLGPRGENAEVLERLVIEAVRDQVHWRRNFHPVDPVHITEAVKRSPEYLDALDRLEEGYAGLLAFLKKSVPFFSMRYQGHMNWETTLPGILGYFAAMLYNPNNVAFEGSTATTILELLVGDDMCRMLGYKVPDLDRDVPEGTPPPWGHVTCDGTVANIEAVWSARNLKFYPLALGAALERDVRLAAAREQVTVTPAGHGTAVPLAGLGQWPALNLRVDEILGLPAAVAGALGLDEAEGAKLVTDAVAPFSLQTLGYQEFCREVLGDIPSPVVLVPGTKHYSFPKAAALLGIGSANLRDVSVDTDARLDAADLEAKLIACADEGRPVLMAVAVMGSTEESSVDPLNDVLALRGKLRSSHGLDFVVHADAAFGGYHASVGRPDFEMPPAGFADITPPQLSRLSSYVETQYAALGRADSITVDPHKSGYIPYPAGALCYRNSGMRSLVTFAAPVVYHGDAEPTVGIYGVEGSKPGAAVAAVYLSHRVIRPSASGYGYILGRALHACKRLYARLLEIGQDEAFYAVPLPRVPDSIPGNDEQSRVDYLLRHVSRPTDDPPGDLAEHVREIGPDLNILAYAFNFRLPSGQANTSLQLANVFNEAMYRELSLKPFQDIYGQDMIVSTTNLDLRTYGQTFFDAYAARLGTTQVEGVDHITVLRSVVMDPWMTENSEDLGAGNAAAGRGRDFIDTLEGALKRAAAAAYAKVTKTDSWGY
jgi:glutamate/tyrosine decarboxylase-like PLP-dependent enzyme